MFSMEEYEFLLHEIKNYVCLIHNSMQLISRQHPEVSEFPYWQETTDDISHLTLMCRELSAARLHGAIHKEPVRPEVFFSHLQQTAEGFLTQGAAFSLEVPADLPELHMDPMRMKHALLNLIKNASEAISPDGQVILSVSAEDTLLQIQVQDNGCGMNPEQLNRIFLPAYTTKSDGTGLGLTITKQIIDAHEGQICCRSNPGQGTVFTLTLPL